MRYCSNPECPHRRATGRPAETVGDVTTCPDCGAELQEKDPDRPSVIGSQPLGGWPKPLKLRLLVTLGIFVALWLTQLVPSPFLNMEAFGELQGFAFDATRSVGPFSLGITPFLVAFVLVEIAVLIFKPSVRHGNPGARRRMTVWACVVGFIVAIAQGYGVALWLESYEWQFHGRVIVLGPGLAFQLLFALTQAAGSAVWLAGATVISRRGVGNGFACLLMMSILAATPPSIWSLVQQVRLGQIAPIGLMLFLVAVFALFASVLWFFKKYGPAQDRSEPICVLTCGQVPLEIAVSLVMLPATLANLFVFVIFQRLASMLTPNALLTLVVELLIVVVTVPLVSTLFYWRHRERLKNPELVAQWRWAQLQSGLLLVSGLVAYILLQRILGAYLSAELPTLLTVLLATALFLDFKRELAARRALPDDADLVVLEEHQDVVDALEARSEYHEADRQLVIQGLYFRSLIYFFGPYVPLKLLGRPNLDDRLSEPEVQNTKQ